MNNKILKNQLVMGFVGAAFWVLGLSAPLAQTTTQITPQSTIPEVKVTQRTRRLSPNIKEARSTNA